LLPCGHLYWHQQRRNDTPEEFNWHALRHFAVSCWIDAGPPPKTVQTFAGHSSLQVTMDRYGHLLRSDSPVRAEPPKNGHRKWSDFVP